MKVGDHVIAPKGCMYDGDERIVTDVTSTWVKHVDLSGGHGCGEAYREFAIPELTFGTIVYHKDVHQGRGVIIDLDPFDNTLRVCWEESQALVWHVPEELTTFKPSLPIVELTLEDVAKLKGIPVERLRIKE